MDRTAPAAHASHDELLLARLYGGDLDERERAQALDRMAECDECAAVFADLGAFAGAVAALPVPPRPRDFSLTESDAARLRRPAPARPAFFGAGLRRALGSSLAALGLVGAVLTGSASLMVQTASPASNLAFGDSRQNVPVAAGAASQQDTAIAVASPGAKASALPYASQVPDYVNGQPSQSPATEYGPATQDGGNSNGGGSIKSYTYGDQNQGGADSRLVWLIGFGVLFIVGLGILVVPWAIARSRRS